MRTQSIMLQWNSYPNNKSIWRCDNIRKNGIYRILKNATKINDTTEDRNEKFWGKVTAIENDEWNDIINKTK